MRHLIKGALIALAAVAAYFVYGFTAQVAPAPFAIAAAGSLVGTYIGLAFADIPPAQRRNARRVAVVAMAVEAAYGTLYVLSLQYPAFFAAPPVWVAVPLAALHGAAFSVLAYLVSLFVVDAHHEAPPADPLLVLAEQVARLAEQRAADVPALPALARQAHYPPPVPVQLTTTTTEASARAARTYACEQCGATLTLGQYGASKRHGHCRSCRPA